MAERSALESLLFWAYDYAVTLVMHGVDFSFGSAMFDRDTSFCYGA